MSEDPLHTVKYFDVLIYFQIHTSVSSQLYQDLCLWLQSLGETNNSKACE